MKRKRDRKIPIELGAASVETRGGPWGAEDYRGSLMVSESGLTQD